MYLMLYTSQSTKYLIPDLNPGSLDTAGLDTGYETEYLGYLNINAFLHLVSTHILGSHNFLTAITKNVLHSTEQNWPKLGPLQVSLYSQKVIPFLINSGRLEAKVHST